MRHGKTRAHRDIVARATRPDKETRLRSRKPNARSTIERDPPRLRPRSRGLVPAEGSAPSEFMLASTEDRSPP